MTKEFNAFEMAQRQFDSVADKLQLDESFRELLRWPQREYHFTIPVRQDDGSWLLTEVDDLEAVLELPAANARLALKEIYRRVPGL